MTDLFDLSTVLGPSPVPGVLDVAARRPPTPQLPPNLRPPPSILTTPSGRQVIFPADLQQSLAESAQLLAPSALVDTSPFARLPRAQRPSPLPVQALRAGPTGGGPVMANLQRNQTTLLNKYTEMAPTLRQLPPDVARQLRDMDVERVTQGRPPLTRPETIDVAQTLIHDVQATPERERGFSFGDIWEGFKSNVGDIASIFNPVTLGGAIVSEITQLPHAAERFQEARAAGQSPLRALFESTPGVRFLPGAYIAANIETPGELVRNPLFTALDVAPFARPAAGATRVGRAAQARALESVGRISAARPQIPYRPVRALLTERVDPATGQLAPNVLGRRLGTPTEPGQLAALPGFQTITRAFGRRERAAARVYGRFDQRIVTFLAGKGHDMARLPVETLTNEMHQLLKRWEDTYPTLSPDVVSTNPRRRAEIAQSNAEIVRALESRAPAEALHPGFVAEMRDFQHRWARELGVREGTLGEVAVVTPGGRRRVETYPINVAQRIWKREDLARQADLMVDLRQHILSPSSISVTQLREYQAIAQMPRATGRVGTRLRKEANRALDQLYDAYGVTADQVDNAVPGTAFQTPHMPLADMLAALKGIDLPDRQVIFAEAAVRQGLRGELATRLRNMQARAQPPAAVTPELVASLRSYAARRAFADSTLKPYTPARASRAQLTLANMVARTPPARARGVLTEEARARVTRTFLDEAETRASRPLTGSEVAAITDHVVGQAWRGLPHLDPQWVDETVRAIERDVVRSWQQLVGEGEGPVFVHHVTPHRAAQTLRPQVGAVQPRITQVAEAGKINYSPRVNDLSISLSHQAKEYLEREYSLQGLDQIIEAMARPVGEIRQQYLPQARRAAAADPRLDVAGHLDRLVTRMWEQFDPDTHGYSWGGSRVNRYASDQFMVPKTVAANMKQMAQRISLLSEVADPLTRAFRYNVIGLSPQVTINNFFSNVTAASAETGLGWMTKFPAAIRMWTDLKRNPERVPEQFRQLLAAEQPFMEQYGRDWKTAARVQAKSGANARFAFNQSAAAEGVRRFGQDVRRVTDFVVRKNLAAQRWGDAVIRGAVYLRELDRWGKQTRKGRGPFAGLSYDQAVNASLEVVNRTIVDYAAFTPIERNAIRQMIPFYSYASHAARFITRYPADHPIRVSVMAGIARVHKDRLGALPGSFLSMYALPDAIFGADKEGHTGFLNMRFFSPFIDTADLFSFAGWVGAANPAIQTLLQQFGISRGEQDLYPELQYDPETGRMRAVRPSIIESALFSAIPRFATVASALGLNPTYNEIRARDPAAAQRSLLSQAGVPRIYQDVDVYEEQTRAELARQQAANDAKNEALRSGDWSEALLYPSLRSYYQQVLTLTPQQRAALTPPDPEATAQMLRRLTGVG